VKFLTGMEPTEKAEATATVASVFMAAGMIAVAVMSGSVSVLAEGIDTVVDVVASVAVLIGLRLSRRHSRDFPNGLYKLENLVAVAIGVLILVSAYELARESIHKLMTEGTRNGITGAWVAMATMAVVVVVTWLLASYKARVGKANNSPSLIADAKHSWTDTVASAAVILGVGLQAAGVPYVDSIVALAIVAFLAWSSIEVIRDGVKVLLDASIEKEVLEQTRSFIESDPRVRRVVAVEGRNSGSFRFLHITIVPDTSDIREADALATELKESLKKEIQNVEEIAIDFSAEAALAATFAVPLAEDGRTVPPHLGDASSFSLISIDPDGQAVVERVPVDNVLAPGTPGHDVKLAVMLARHGVGYLIAREILPEAGAWFVLRANDISVIVSPDVKDIETAETKALGAVGVAANLATVDVACDP